MQESNGTNPEFIWGASAIASAIGVPRRRAYYLLEQRLIPARKVGDSWVAERSKLIAALAGEVSA